MPRWRERGQERHDERAFCTIGRRQAGFRGPDFFSDPVGTIAADEPHEVAEALSALENARKSGLHAAGYFSYELGYCLEARLKPLFPRRRDVPLLWFGLFRASSKLGPTQTHDWLERNARGRAYAGPLHFAETRESYASKFNRVQDYIAAGDVYQVNLTFPGRFAFAGDPLGLYRRLRLRAAAGHGAYVFDGARHVLSFLPELFFSIAHGMLTAQPMKGTAPRAVDKEEDSRLRASLGSSEKDRAENLMIVDLIRNDLSRIAVTGSVRAENLFAVETYPTVHQMISTVRGELRPGITPAELVRAMFPCGSITGTPKIRASEIIRELEPEPRGIYCGAIGAFSPDGDAQFNVAIRTLTLSDGRGTLGVGSGLVADSQMSAEYEECLIKARFFSEERPAIALIETLRREPERGLIRGELHLERMERSAETLGLPFDREAALVAVAVESIEPSRVRLQLDEDGSLSAISRPLAATVPDQVWTYAVSEKCVWSGDALARHKTNWRELYEAEYSALNRSMGCDDVIFLNERGEVTEGSRTNVFIRRDGKLVTLPLSSGLLDGCLRRALLESGECAEAVLTLVDLEQAETVYLGNSLRGLVRARAAVP